MNYFKNLIIMTTKNDCIILYQFTHELKIYLISRWITEIKLNSVHFHIPNVLINCNPKYYHCNCERLIKENFEESLINYMIFTYFLKSIGIPEDIIGVIMNLFII